MTDKTVNIPLLRKAVEWAEAEHAKPGGGAYLQSHYQMKIDNYLAMVEDSGSLPDTLNWLESVHVSPSCGTAYCIAGYVGALLEPELFGRSEAAEIDGETVHVAHFAAEQLGLDMDTAYSLFSGSNTIEDVRRIAEELAGEPL